MELITCGFPLTDEAYLKKCEMLVLPLYAMYAGAVSSTVDSKAQFSLTGIHGAQDVPGDSIVKRCPEFRYDDVLAIERIVNQPQIPYL